MKRDVQQFSLRQDHSGGGVCPDSDKDLEQYEARLSSVLKVLREERRGGAKEVFHFWRSQCGTWDHVYAQR